MTRSKIHLNKSASAQVFKAASSTVLCMAALLPVIANAANWEVDPVRIELSPQQQTAAITLKNTSDQPTSIQIQVVSWTQADGQDVYVSSRELLVSPPIVTIPAHGEQVVRAALRRPADPGQELSYRINLQEIPPAPVPGFMGVQMAMRVGLPVFVEPVKGKSAPKMVWQLQHAANNQLKVSLQNQGNGHVQVTDFSLHLPGASQAVASESGSSYIMPGQSRTWLLKATSGVKVQGGRLQLKAFTDAGDVDTSLALGKQ